MGEITEKKLVGLMLVVGIFHAGSLNSSFGYWSTDGETAMKTSFSEGCQKEKISYCVNRRTVLQTVGPRIANCDLNVYFKDLIDKSQVKVYFKNEINLKIIRDLKNYGLVLLIGTSVAATSTVQSN